MSDQDLERLLAERKRINAEIRATPPPIPACDVAFNALLERRRQLDAAIKALRLPDRTRDHQLASGEESRGP